MGISEETTKMRLHRARVFLRNALAGYVRRADMPEARAHD
jgi:DNA-directed RNA polymerase specialized sigma24 family protein